MGQRVARVLHAGGREAEVHSRQRLVDELARAEPAFALPELLDVGGQEGRVYAIDPVALAAGLPDTDAAAFVHLASAVYLTSREITSTSRPSDVDVIMSWLRAAGLDECFEPVRRWLAAYWSFALDDLAVTTWSRTVLL
jgi:hypothetical protein